MSQLTPDNSNSKLEVLPTFETIFEPKNLHPAFTNAYTIQEVLGSGGFGVVVTAKRRIDDKEVAVKFIYKDKVPRCSWVEDKDYGWVPMEVYVIKNVKHKNIIGFVDFFQDKYFVYLVMNLHGVSWVHANSSEVQKCDYPTPTPSGESLPPCPPTGLKRRSSMDLFECIEKHTRLSESVSKKIFRQVVDAVDCLLEQNIVHRDIKDENIVVDDDYNVKLIDMGSAAFLPKEGRLFDRFAGTLQYCPPEILLGLKYRGPEQEVWTLGVLLYTMMFAEPPFPGPMEVIKCPLTVPKSASCSDEVLDLLFQLTRKNPSERPSLEVIKNHKWFQT
ncbi:hypothetical protein HMI54_011108 [Coelomomyces lativittatus]|nr:hypothetical protein HMI56_005212 [Coelomomyces lativittatus]KAJ1514543.1 hypothetical protein HMI55_004572 [Coelomomyces lativittatus]KAJ1516038.1 hypothetical protein HMI54_011108 [Coelomomyces lativittatus]